MDGDFKSDFSRDSSDPQRLRQFSRVLMQQGRVQLDADWNEQADSLLYYLRTLASDIIGPAGGRDQAFEIDHIKDTQGNAQDDKDFTIHTGHYYVDGILCANDAVDKNGAPVSSIKYTSQPYNPDYQVLSGLGEGKVLVYLDVWERQVTALENDNIREVALGPSGPDTATRGEIVWQVRLIKTDQLPSLDPNNPPVLKDILTEHLQSKNRGQLIASTDDNPDTATHDPCTISPDAKFRGEENQLYRVEIHTGGTPLPSGTASASTQSKATTSRRGRKKSQQQASEPGVPTFKWSRENGSVVFLTFDSIQVNENGTITVSLDNLGRDNSRLTLVKDDWVELLTLSSSLTQTPGQMLLVSSVDYTSMQAVLTPPTGTSATSIGTNYPVPPFLLRRWDYHEGDEKQGGLTIADDGAAQIIEDRPLKLEKGIQITFKRPSPSAGATDHPTPYRTGDYWLIPARTVAGTILWPSDENRPLQLPPRGINHHYALLAFITPNSEGIITAGSEITNLRSKFK